MFLIIGLATLAIVILAIVILLIVHYPQKLETERLIASGLDRLAAAEQATVSEAEQAIDQLLEAEKQAEKSRQEAEASSQAAEKTDQLSNQEIRTVFKNAVFVGDSLTEAIEYYQFLPKNNVVYKRGMSVPNAGELFPTIVGLDPDQVFLSFGMNDLLYFDGDADAFAKAYQEKLLDLREQLPDAEIFITSVLPLRQNAIDKKPAFSHCAEFNQALSKMCTENGVTFIDCTALAEAHADLYEPDGIHVKATFYPYWFALVADKAGLL